MKDTAPVAVYRQQIERLTTERKAFQKRKNSIAWGRLAVILLTAITGYFLFATAVWLMLVAVTAGLALFLRLVVMSLRVSEQLANTDRLLRVNEQELATAAGMYQQLPDGSAYLPEKHPYAYDLDIFGRSSLFQYMNRSATGQGERTLANWLLQPATAKVILERQAAAKELAPQLEWRQQLQAHGMAHTITEQMQHRIMSWLQEDNSYFQPSVWRVVRWAGPAISLTILGLYLLGHMAFEPFLLWMAGFFAITGFISKKATPAYQALGKMAPEAGTLSAMIRHIENAAFQTDTMKALQDVFLQPDEKASRSVRLLNGILARLDYRLNPVVFIPLNIFLFWDLQQMLAFEKWKRKHAAQINLWFGAVGATEALSGMAALAYNHPDWVFPGITENRGAFAAEALGHPLIAADKVVRSSFNNGGSRKVIIITGSNMAGKSTFLRSVGLALVMGQAGAPVCAREAAFACMQVISTMRISDNLEESTSTFYAELKKLKEIIDAVNRKENVFLLMDEILRGTNSLDRHTGSKALIRQLVRHQASGIIATHDLALSELQTDYPSQIDNYHFDVQVAGEELYFDYKLKTGVCQSLNASVLMKKIGIEM